MREAHWWSVLGSRNSFKVAGHPWHPVSQLLPQASELRVVKQPVEQELGMLARNPVVGVIVNCALRRSR
eukprot:11220983-Lingulodinium_polyedra.AAC.1